MDWLDTSADGSWYHWVLYAALGAFFAFKLGALFASKVLFPGTKRQMLPPSPGVMPIVGSFPFMGATSSEPSHKMINRLAEKFGPIFYLRLGSSPTIVVSNSEIAKQVLKDQDHNFGSRPPNISSGKYLGVNYRTTGFAPTGEYHKRVRRIYSQELFAAKRVQGTHAARENGVYAVLGAIYQQHKEGKDLINLSILIKDLTLNSILGALYRWKDDSSEGGKEGKSIGTVKLSDLKDLIRQIVKLAGEFNAGDFIAIARWLDLQGVMGHLKKVDRKMRDTAAALIQEYDRSGRKSADTPDATIFDVLLSLEGDDKLNLEDLTGVTYDLVIAGSDSTGNSADWTIAEILRQPELVRRLHAELDSVIGKDRFVKEADLPSLPFLQAAVKESLRMHPPAPLGLPHYSLADCKLAGYDIPAGTTTLMNFYAINRDPEQWTEPSRFNPDRFFKQDINMFGNTYHFLPFSSGRRSCPGMIMGFTLVQLIVANFMHGFEFQPAGGLSNDDIDVITEVPGVFSVRAQDLLLSVTPRLNSEVYEKFVKF